MCVWTEDADAIKWDDEQLKMVYMNQRIKEYLHNNRKLGIAATKGQGKTFLIKAKRRQYQNPNIASEDKRIACFPLDDMVDTLDSSVRVNKSLHKLLINYPEWVSLWKISIAVTIISSDEFEELFDKEKDFNKIRKETRELFNIDNRKNRPSVVLSYLLGLKYYELKDILEDASIIIHLLDRITNGIYIFIDKVDQAFSVDIYNIQSDARNASYWQYCQYGLANAAYELMSNVNSHIKVFYTIRHEALIDSEWLAKNTARNVEAFLTELVYTKEDIYEMFKLYVQNEDDKNLYMAECKYVNQEKAFFGFDTIEHAYVIGMKEKVFDYLYRHSLRRPYDIMKICKELYLAGSNTLTKDKVRHVINETSGKVLRMYFSEVAPFITCEYKEIKKLLTCINTNIFDISYIHYVCKRYNEEYEMENVCNKDCSNCKNEHPFSTLYNIGILGCLTNSLAHPKYKQHFLPIGESKLKLNEYDLPTSSLYVLHPCLCDEARRLRGNKNRKFITANETIVGEGVEISDQDIAIISKRRINLLRILDKEKVFISSTINDLEEERASAKQLLYDKGYYPILSEQDNFGYAPNNIHSHDYCIDELVKCKQMICIIGKEYGGIYAGDRYESYIEKIRKESGGEIEQPSISLMEFFVGKSKGLVYRIFVQKRVLDEKKVYEKDKENYNGYIDKRVFKLINFINHLEDEGKKKGNWFVNFDSIERFTHQLASVDFIK